LQVIQNKIRNLEKRKVSYWADPISLFKHIGLILQE
jgi:hypothetical protein